MSDSQARPLQLTVPTASLRKLLEDQPDVQLKLEGMACEKIAEEILRKARQQQMSIANSVATIVQKAFDEATASFKNQWKFPAEAQAVIRKVASDAVHEFWVQEANKFENRRAQLFEDAARAAQVRLEQGIILSLEAKIRRIAKEEFFSVLESARSAPGRTKTKKEK